MRVPPGLSSILHFMLVLLFFFLVEILILCIFVLCEYRESVDSTILSRMHESASKLVSSGRSANFANIFKFRALPEAICTHFGSAQSLPSPLNCFWCNWVRNSMTCGRNFKIRDRNLLRFGVGM